MKLSESEIEIAVSLFRKFLQEDSVEGTVESKSDETVEDETVEAAAPHDGRQRFMTAREAADYLRVGKSTFYEQVKLGKIPFIMVGSRMRFSCNELDRCFETRRN